LFIPGLESFETFRAVRFRTSVKAAKTAKRSWRAALEVDFPFL
jgi:hypothetical protein